jgi:HEAT repeat protein
LQPPWLSVSGSWLKPSCTRLVAIPDESEGDAARRRTTAIAGHTGDELAARAALHDPAHEVRASALGALARIGVLEPFEVSAALAYPAAEVRRRACDVAGRLRMVELAPRLTEALSDPAPAVTEAACYALGELEELGEDGPPAAATVPAGAAAVTGGAATAAAAVRALQAIATDHPEPLCREAAVAALGSLGWPAGLVAVLAALDDKPAVRRRAVVALASFEGPDVDVALARAAQDVDWQVRQAAEDLLGYRPRPT